MIEGYLQFPGVHGNSTEPAHRGWIELLKLEVKPDQTRRRAPAASVTSPVLPVFVYGWAILGPHARELRAAWALGSEFGWGVLEVFRPANGKPLLLHRLRMTAVHVMSYEPNYDPGFVKPIMQFVLAPTTYSSEVGSTLRLTLIHEQTHAAGGAPRAPGGPLQRPARNDRTPPSGHP